MKVSGKLHGLPALSPSTVVLQNQHCFRPNITNFRLSAYWTKTERQFAYNVILRGDRVTKVTMAKQYLLHILIVCL